MSNQDRLLSDEELRDRLRKIDDEYLGRLDDNVIDDGKTAWVWKYDTLIQLFDTQKKLYAESVIGEDEHQYDDAKGRCMLCIDNSYCYHELRNELRAEQRARIK